MQAGTWHAHQSGRFGKGRKGRGEQIFSNNQLRRVSIEEDKKRKSGRGERGGQRVSRVVLDDDMQ